MLEKRDNDRTEKNVHPELDALSKMLQAQVPHFFCIFDREKEQFVHWTNIGDGEAGQIIELLAKNHGGGVIDRVIDKLIEEGDQLHFPEFID